MARITVYRFWIYDFAEDTSHLSPTHRTEADIRRMGHEPAPETAITVDEAELDWNGRYSSLDANAKS